MPALSRSLTVAFMALGLFQAPLSSVGAQGLPPASNPSNPDALTSAAFLADPSSLLAAYPLGGGGLVSAVRNLVVGDLKTLSSLLTLTLSATDDQKNAIGTGLGLAALVLLPTNPQAASVIQSGLVSFNDPTLLAAYAAVTGNQRLATAGPGAGGGGGSPGSGEASTSPQTGGSGITSASFLFPSFGTKNIADVFVIPPIPTFTASTPTDPSDPSDPPDPPTTVGDPVSATTP
jgi:hypothetical protein